MQKSQEFLEQEKRYKEIEKIEDEIEILKESINTIGNGLRYWSVFQLDKDDLQALVKVREEKLSKHITSAHKTPRFSHGDIRAF